jgi:hypothetical protein
MSDKVTREEFDALEQRVVQVEERTTELEEEFGAIEQRVTKLEERTTELEQEVFNEDTDEGDNDLPLVDAKPIATLIETLGVNTFSSLDEHNTWGSWPADYRPETVIKALRYIVGDNAYHIGIREYHYANKIEMQTNWLGQIRTAFPHIDITMCIGANGTVGDVPTMIELWRRGYVSYLEGINEPNTDFGQGMIPVDQTMEIQHQIFGYNNQAMSPSVVAGMPHPEGWITGYFDSRMIEVTGIIQYANGHYYPPGNPDIIGNGTSVTDYIGGLWTAYINHEVMLTEFHPTLYNNESNAPGDAGWNGHRDAYYTLMTLLRCVKCNVRGLWWYALFDYGSVYKCGMFETNDTNPRPIADVLRNLCQLCPESNRNFAGDIVSLVVDYDPEYYDVYANSEGDFFVFLWKAQNYAVDVLITTDNKFLTEYDLISGEMLQSGREALICRLENTVRLVKIAP